MERMSAQEYRNLNAKTGSMFKIPKANKYNAQKTEMGGKSYHSQGEANFAWELKQQEKAGIIEGFDEQVKESFYMNGHFICNYYVDFLVYLPNGKRRYVEYKGAMTELARIKIKMLKAKYKDDKNVEVAIEWHKSKYKYKLK